MEFTHVKFSGPALERVIRGMEVIVNNEETIWSLRIAYDPIDQAIKFKVNERAWGRPFTEGN